jgi:hypothetical protein
VSDNPTPWISGRITELLGVEDDVVILYVFSFLDDGLKAKDGFVDPKVGLYNFNPVDP